GDGGAARRLADRALPRLRPPRDVLAPLQLGRQGRGAGPGEAAATLRGPSPRGLPVAAVERHAVPWPLYAGRGAIGAWLEDLPMPQVRATLRSYGRITKADLRRLASLALED